MTLARELTTLGQVAAQALGTTLQDSVTATASGNQATGVLVTGNLVVVSVCATNNDSIRLPVIAQLTLANDPIVVVNLGAASLRVFPGSGDLINGGAANAGVDIAAGKAASFYRRTATSWVAMIGA